MTSPVTLDVNGRPLVVRNTFIEVVDDEARSPRRERAKSDPNRRAVPLELLTAGEERLDQATREEHLGELHRRLLGPTGKSQLDAAETASTAAPSSVGLSVESSSPFEGADQVPRVRYDQGVTSHGREPAGEGGRTTLMFRNLPEGFGRATLEQLLDAEGFAGRYDFLYLPANLGSGACFGYALINMVRLSDVAAFMAHFQGFQDWPMSSDKRAVVHMSEELQGLEEMIERYRNSPLMHPSVSDVLRPAIYRDGCRDPFPEPTAPLKPPRVRKANRAGQ